MDKGRYGKLAEEDSLQQVGVESRSSTCRRAWSLSVSNNPGASVRLGTYQRESSMKKARFSDFARPYDIHNRISVVPNPGSSVSMT